MLSDSALIQDVSVRWATAVANAEIEALRALMTEDIVVIHGNGRLVEGREALAEDFRRSFAGLQIIQQIDLQETIIAGDWAFSRADVHTTITPRSGGEVTHSDSRTITLLRRDSLRGWRVARAIGVPFQTTRAWRAASA